MWQKKVIQDVRWRAGCVVAPQLHDVLNKNSIEHHQKLPEINLGQEKVLNYNMGTLTKCPLVNPLKHLFVRVRRCFPMPMYRSHASRQSSYPEQDVLAKFKPLTRLEWDGRGDLKQTIQKSTRV